MGTLKYWFHPGPEDGQMAPLVLFHGISPGWSPYIKLAKTLGAGRPLLMVDLGCIQLNTMDFTRVCPEAFSAEVSAVLRRHSFSQCSVAGHSFGTIAASWFVQRKPEVIN